jgi:SAM-dependent methyltransferase
MGGSLAFGGNDRSAARWFAQAPYWWDDHFVNGVDQILSFLEGDGISLEGQTVVDLGCGDGIFALGLCRRTLAAEVVAMDLVEVDLAFLGQVAKEHGEDLDRGPLPRFVRSKPDVIPLPDRSVDVVVSWSVFEHVAEPATLAREAYRVLRNGGVFVVQIWPLFASEHGSHLWPFFDEPFVQWRLDEAAIEAHLRRDQPELASAMMDLYRSCNRLTVDDLQAALRSAGFYLSKVELQHDAFHVPPELQDVPISRLGISGIKALATRPG